MTNYHGRVWHRTEFNWQRKTQVRPRLGAAPFPQASGWATDPSTLLLDLLAMVGDESSQRLAT